MTIKALKKLIAALPDNMEVWASQDSEGNHFSQLDSIEMGYVEKAVKYGVDTIYSESWSFEDAAFESEEEWEKFKSKKAKKVLVIWP